MKVSRYVLKPSQNGDISGLGQPTPEQQTLLRQTLGCVRLVYNKALAVRTEGWYERQEKIDYSDTSVMLTAWKKEENLSFLTEVSSVPLQQGLRNLQKAFANFWAKRASYPNFKKKHNGGSAEFTKAGFRWKNNQLFLAKCDEALPITWSRQLPPGCSPSTVTVKLDAANRWFVSLLVDDHTVKPLETTDKSVGLDVGINVRVVYIAMTKFTELRLMSQTNGDSRTLRSGVRRKSHAPFWRPVKEGNFLTEFNSLIATSTGEKIANPRHFKRLRRKLRQVQKSLSRKKKGSNNRHKARLKVAKVHAKITDARKDFLHKLTTQLVRENQTIVVEDLAIKNMVKNPKLALHISDASWGELIRQLDYKCRWYGRDLIKIDHWFPSSKRCGNCGHIVEKLPLNIREWECPKCGTHHDRDLNAAKNILAAGLAVSVCGANVRPDSLEAEGQLRNTRKGKKQKPKL